MSEGSGHRVSHPILRLEVLHADGTRRSAHRVFCKHQHRVIPIGVCCGCVHCASIDTEPVPAVHCVVEAKTEAPPSDPLGHRTPVGAVLHVSAYAVMPDTSVRDTFATLRGQDRRSLPVVDAGDNLLGIVDEMRCREVFGKTAASVMSSKLSLDALTPVRRALELMAAAHLREITVLDGEGRPLGMLRDVDALRWLAEARRQA